MITIVITVEGGVVVDIFSDTKEIDVVLVDRDAGEVYECVIDHEPTDVIKRLIEDEKEVYGE